MPFTHIAANDILDQFLADNPDIWVGLFTALPTKSGGGTEVTGGSYARIAVVSADVFPAASSSETANDEVLSFPTPSANWGSIVAWGIFDAVSAGDLLAWYPLPTPKVINTGDNAAFPIGNLIIKNV